MAKDLFDTKVSGYKKIMVEAAMLKIITDVERKFSYRFNIESTFEYLHQAKDLLFKINRDNYLIGREVIKIKTKSAKEVMLHRICLPEDMENKICEVLKRQRHMYWFLNLYYSEQCGTPGLGALLTKCYPV